MKCLLAIKIQTTIDIKKSRTTIIHHNIVVDYAVGLSERVLCLF